MAMNETAEVQKTSQESVDTVHKILTILQKEAGFAASLRAAGMNTQLASFVESFVTNPILHELKDQKKRIQNAVQLKLVAFLVIMDMGNYNELKAKIAQVKYAFGESSLTLWVYVKQEQWNRNVRAELYRVESNLRAFKELSHINLDFMILPDGLKEVPSNLTILPLPPYAKQ